MGKQVRVVVAHNYYQQAGGEDEVFASEVAMLRAHGHDVQTFVMHNDDIELMGKLSVFRKTLWNGSAYRQTRRVIQETRAQVVHFHNTFPLMSPAVFRTAHRAGVPTVMMSSPPPAYTSVLLVTLPTSTVSLSPVP